MNASPLLAAALLLSLGGTQDPDVAVYGGIEIAMAKGKKLHDKRQATADRDWARDKARLMRAKG